MDKKKVIDIITKSILHIDRAYKFGDIDVIEATADIQRWLKEAIEELKKSDWISVDDKLPSYEEAVLVTSNEEPEETYFSHRTNRKEVIVDKHQFATYRGSKPITHWRRIDKLEE